MTAFKPYITAGELSEMLSLLPEETQVCVDDAKGEAISAGYVIAGEADDDKRPFALISPIADEWAEHLDGKHDVDTVEGRGAIIRGAIENIGLSIAIGKKGQGKTNPRHKEVLMALIAVLIRGCPATPAYAEVRPSQPIDDPGNPASRAQLFHEAGALLAGFIAAGVHGDGVSQRYYVAKPLVDADSNGFGRLAPDGQATGLADRYRDV